MANERQAAPQPKADFARMTRPGQSIAGKIVRFGATDNGAFAVFSPGYLREQIGGEWEKYGTVAVGLSTDIRDKIDEKTDKNKSFVFVYDRNEPTSRGGQKKIFKVLELDDKEAGELDAKSKFRGALYEAPEQSGRSEADDSESSESFI
jgi:hypothetical protein